MQDAVKKRSDLPRFRHNLPWFCLTRVFPTLSRSAGSLKILTSELSSRICKTVFCMCIFSRIACLIFFLQKETFEASMQVSRRTGAICFLSLCWMVIADASRVIFKSKCFRIFNLISICICGCSVFSLIKLDGNHPSRAL